MTLWPVPPSFILSLKRWRHLPSSHCSGWTRPEWPEAAFPPPPSGVGPGGKGWAGEAAPSRAHLCGSPTKLLLPTWPFSGTKAISSETHFFSWTARASSVNETPRQCEDPSSGPGPSSGVCRSWTSTRLSMSHGELACQLDACVCRSWTQAPRPPGGSGLSGSI